VTISSQPFAFRLKEKSVISTLPDGKRNTNGANVVVLILLLFKSIMKEQIMIHNKDGRKVKYKIVFGAAANFCM